ncbi:MAG: prolipoprotein diacylglyceryl transferase, partial [Alphaproteobacteria bacterium]|nr:prolipoprotein diacylglyceryl transferase [Alphaproteobacteria bacterium]
MPFPDIDPVLIQLGPLAIRWYALAYVAGFLLGWLYIRRQRGAILTEAQLESLFTWAVLGVILGGRTGYVLFYNLPFYLEHPLDIPAVWKGGMSFHGGMAGLLLGVWLFCRRQKLAFLAVMDLMAIAAPIGLFFGRI